MSVFSSRLCSTALCHQLLFDHMSRFQFVRQSFPHRELFHRQRASTALCRPPPPALAFERHPHYARHNEGKNPLIISAQWPSNSQYIAEDTLLTPSSHQLKKRYDTLLLLDSQSFWYLFTDVLISHRSVMRSGFYQRASLASTLISITLYAMLALSWTV